MDKPVCLIDLDDTLADLKEPMMKAMNAHTGKSIHWSTWADFDVSGIYEVPSEEFLQVCIDDFVLERAEIHDSTYNFMNILKRNGAYVVLITARGWHPRGGEITEEWILGHSLDVDEVIVVGEHESKAGVMAKHFDRVSFTVDDRMKHCREYKQSGIVDTTVVYTTPWNEYKTSYNPFIGTYDFDLRVRDLNEILFHLDWINDNYKEKQNVC